MTRRENLLRAARFERPDHIPVSFHVTAPCWTHYPQEALQELMADHPLLFPGFEPSSEPIVPRYAPFRRAGQPYADSWGCVWQTTQDGFTGSVARHALPTWDGFDRFVPPDPEEHDGWQPVDWERIARHVADAKANGRLASGSLRHGHTFLTLSYIRGYESLLFDMADGEPRLARLIEMVEHFNQAVVRRYVGLGVEWMGYPEDLGMQVGPLVSPALFRTFIQPVYRRLMAPAREAGCVVHMHSDGDIRALADDLLDCGIEVLNLQDLVNGIDWMAERLKGRVCIDLDVDRQRITRFGTPAAIDALIRTAVETLGSRHGGLMLRHGFVPGAPLENVEALMDALERYATRYA